MATGKHQNSDNNNGDEIKRITLDIPRHLHKAVKDRAYDLRISMKQYFLELAQKDLGIKEEV